MKRKNQYLMTLDGQPALWDGFQIARPCIQRSQKLRLVKSLREVKRLVQKSIANRLAKGWDAKIEDYGYWLVSMDPRNGSRA